MDQFASTWSRESDIPSAAGGKKKKLEKLDRYHHNQAATHATCHPCGESQVIAGCHCPAGHVSTLCWAGNSILAASWQQQHFLVGLEGGDKEQSHSGWPHAPAAIRTQHNALKWRSATPNSTLPGVSLRLGDPPRREPPVKQPPQNKNCDHIIRQGQRWQKHHTRDSPAATDTCLHTLHLAMLCQHCTAAYTRV